MGAQQLRPNVHRQLMQRHPVKLVAKCRRRLSQDMPPDIITLIEECWSDLPGRRPDAHYVHRVLEHMIKGCARRYECFVRNNTRAETKTFSITYWNTSRSSSGRNGSDTSVSVGTESV